MCVQCELMKKIFEPEELIDLGDDDSVIHKGLFPKKERLCFYCKRSIHVDSFVNNALEIGFNYEQIKKMWLNDMFEIVCCSCYEKIFKWDEI